MSTCKWRKLLREYLKNRLSMEERNDVWAKAGFKTETWVPNMAAISLQIASLEYYDYFY